MSGKVGYYIGVSLGLIMIYGLYALGIYGIVTYIINREIPYLPILLMMAVFSARRMAQIQLYMELSAKVEARRQKLSELDGEMQKMMFKVSQFGRNN